MPSLRIWPVIHVLDAPAAIANAAIAASAGAYGVFLIQMDGQDHLLDPIGKAIAQEFPSLALGVNYLSMEADFALSRSIRQGYQATWSDKPGVRSDGANAMAEAAADQLRRVEHTFFASVAFKYQPVDHDPGKAAQQALALGMVPTTSGSATGVAPNLEKLRLMRQAIGSENRLAVASGVTPVNVGAIAPYVTDILVATGIGRDFYTFDAGLLQQLLTSARP